MKRLALKGRAIESCRHYSIFFCCLPARSCALSGRVAGGWFVPGVKTPGLSPTGPFGAKKQPKQPFT
jgi:hypothetical protein